MAKEPGSVPWWKLDLGTSGESVSPERQNFRDDVADGVKRGVLRAFGYILLIGVLVGFIVGLIEAS